MGDTNMDKDDDLVDYNEVDLNGNPIPKPNEGDESPPEDPDWTFDDEQQEQWLPWRVLGSTGVVLRSTRLFPGTMVL